MKETSNLAAEVTPAGDRDRVGAPDLRDLFRLWPTGVAVIAGLDGSEPLGMTCNSLTSVSLEPRLISFCVARSSTTWPRLRSSRQVCVNLLAQGQQDLGRLFAARHPSRFQEIDWHRRRTGPGLAGALAWVDCVVKSEIDAGDHTIVLAEVEDFELDRGGESPLVFHGGRFTVLDMAAAS